MILFCQEAHRGRRDLFQHRRPVPRTREPQMSATLVFMIIIDIVRLIDEPQIPKLSLSSLSL